MITLYYLKKLRDGLSNFCDTNNKLISITGCNMLEYIALGILVFVFITLFYGVIVIHDIPYEIAKKRNHPQQDALHVAGWISLFTLHVLWPFLWIWATLYREDRGWGFTEKKESATSKETNLQVINLQNLINLQNRVETLEAALAIKASKRINTELEDVSNANVRVDNEINNEMKSKAENDADEFDKKTSQLFKDIDELNLEQQQGDK